MFIIYLMLKPLEDAFLCGFGIDTNYDDLIIGWAE
jgi:hypothetical protein